MITLREIHDAWQEGREFRAKRHRHLDYSYGRQWNDIVVCNGKQYIERDLAIATGKHPLTNNMIRPLLKTIVGRMRHRLETGEAPRTSDMTTHRRNMLDELDCRMLEEFLISGCAVQRIVSERRSGGTGIWVDNVDPDRFVCNRYTDPRGNDIELTGMLHDMSIREVCGRFGEGDEGRMRAIARLYEGQETGNRLSLGNSESERFGRASRGRCRVIEGWALETVSMIKCHDRSTGRVFSVRAGESDALDRIDAELSKEGKEKLTRRADTALEWHCYWYAPGGELLSDYRSPYGHGSHPFCVKHYPLTDGEIHSLVEDVVETQRYINRLITLIDQVMGTSAKGVLLFPESQKPLDVTWEEIGERWARPNGVIPYRPNGLGEGPKQIITSTQPMNAYNLLEIEMRLMEQISGVSGALSGQAPTGMQSAALYDAQTQNGMIAIMDMLACFDSFREQRNRKIEECVWPGGKERG